MYLKLKTNSEPSCTPKRKTLRYVVIVHIAFLSTFFIIVYCKDLFWNSNPPSISVNLISPAAYQEISAPSPSIPEQTQMQKKPQKQVEKKQVKEHKAVEKVPTKKAWKPLDISKITKPSESEVKKIEPNKKTTQSQAIQKIDTTALASNLKKSLNSVKFNSTSSSSQNNTAMLTYYDSISSYMYERWEQPSKLAINGAPPSVLVKLFIDTNGKLLNYQILKKSNFPEMDNSVEQLLSSIKNFPPPPNGKISIEATLILTN